MKCPACGAERSPQGFRQHAREHVKKGELIPIQMVGDKSTKYKTNDYAWSIPIAYVLPGSRLAKEHMKLKEM